MDTWHIYGFGFCTDQILTEDVKKLESLLALAPAYHENILECFKERGINDPTWDDYMEMDVDYGLGLPTILQEVIEEADGIRLTACDNYAGEKFLLYEPKYPWACPQAEKALTPETLKTIFEKYIHILTDWKVEIGYHSVENGG